MPSATITIGPGPGGALGKARAGDEVGRAEPQQYGSQKKPAPANAITRGRRSRKSMKTAATTAAFGFQTRFPPGSPGRNHRLERPANAMMSATAVRPACAFKSSSSTGNRRRQFGCSSMVAGTLA
jgi:hypothetical protein